MKKLLTITISALLLAVASFAVASSTLKIGVVDIHQILQNSPKVLKINKGLEAKFKPRQQKIATKEKTYEKEVKKLKRDSSVLGQTEHDKLVAQIASERRELIRMQQDFHDDLSLAQHQALQGLFHQIQTKIDVIAKKEHYDLILQKYGTPYASNSIDITKQVEKLLK